MITIAYLANHTECIATLTAWFRAQWPGYFAGWRREEMEAMFQAEATRQGIPLRLVAFVSGKLAGTIVLRERATDTLPEFRPGLGGLYVLESQRNQGVGSQLVRAGLQAGAIDLHAVAARIDCRDGLLTDERPRSPQRHVQARIKACFSA